MFLWYQRLPAFNSEDNMDVELGIGIWHRPENLLLIFDKYINAINMPPLQGSFYKHAALTGLKFYVPSLSINIPPLQGYCFYVPSLSINMPPLQGSKEM